MTDELRNRAAGDLAWVDSEEATMAKYGSAPSLALKEAWVRLRGLATAALEATPSIGVQGDLSEALRRAERAEEAYAGARRGLRALGAMLYEGEAALDETFGPVADRFKELLEQAGMTAPSGAKEIPLFHGLCLRNAAGEMRLFSEPVNGQWSTQNVAPDGKTAGEPWPTNSSAWPSDVWTIHTLATGLKPTLAKWDSLPTNGPLVQTTLEGTGDVKPIAAAPIEAPKKKIGDFQPDAATVAGWVTSLAPKVNEGRLADQQIPVTESRVREIFAAWQAANRDTTASNPGVSFWHHAKKALAQAT